MYNKKLECLLAGEVVISKETGSSMMPLIKSRQPVELTPSTWQEVEVGDAVYCKVRGRFNTHLVKAKSDKKGCLIGNNRGRINGCLIGNNRGRINGWTKKVYGKVTNIFTSKEEAKLTSCKK
jgi:hypothetical protein